MILDWRFLGVNDDEPFLNRSNTKQDKYNKELNHKAAIFIKEKLLVDIKEGLSRLLKTEINILLNKVVKFKNKFYRDNFAHYDDVLNQNLRLVPDNYRIKELEIDYKNMQEMIFGKVPSFKKILLYLKTLENEINHNCWANNFKT